MRKKVDCKTSQSRPQIRVNNRKIAAYLYFNSTSSYYHLYLPLIFQKQQDSFRKSHSFVVILNPAYPCLYLILVMKYYIILSGKAQTQKPINCGKKLESPFPAAFKQEFNKQSRNFSCMGK